MAQVFHPTAPHSDREAVSDQEIDVGLQRLTRRRLEWLAMGFIVLIALVVQVHQLGVFPDTVLADEADNAQNAVRILYGQHPEDGFFGLDWTE